MNHLDIHAERCVHQQVVASDCDACVRACPPGAWRLHDDGLGFDADACDGCGLCVAACPTGALELPAPQALLHTDARGKRSLLLACERADVHGAAGVVACLYALAPGWLLRQCDTHRAHAIAVAPGDCTHCERGAAGPAWRAHWLAVAARLPAAPQLKPTTAPEWTARASAPAVPDAGRRAFFRRLAPVATRATATASEPALSSARADTVARLAVVGTDAPPAPLWAVTLDTARCTFCMACTRLCPTGALAVELGSAVEQFRLDMARCTGCGLCQAVCGDGALSAPRTPGPDETALATPVRLPLHRRRCPSCRIDFHQFAAPAEGPHSEERCPTCRQGRPWQPKLVVQDATPS